MTAFLDYFHARCVEPVKRNKDGLRWIVHRFPIKAGISLREAMLIDAARPNVLLRMHDGSVMFRGMPVTVAEGIVAPQENA